MIKKENNNEQNLHLSKNKELVEILNEWDLLGVLPNGGGPKDEYDFFGENILNELKKGISQRELENYMENQIISYFGESINETVKEKIKLFSKKILDWYKQI